MRDLSPRQQRNVATDIKKVLKDSLTHCTMNQSHEVQGAAPPSLQNPVTPLNERTMQSPDLDSSPSNCDQGKKPDEKRKDNSSDGTNSLNSSTIVSMVATASSSSPTSQHKDVNHVMLSRQVSHNVPGNRHFDTETKRIPHSASYMHDKHSPSFGFDEFSNEKLNCNSSNNCATKTKTDVLSPHNNNTPSHHITDNTLISRTPSTNSSLSPSSLSMEEGDNKVATSTSHSSAQSGIMENQIRIIDHFDDSEIKDLTNLANNSASDAEPLNPDIISSFSDDENSVNKVLGIPCSSQESNRNFLFSEASDSLNVSLISQVATAASTSPTVTTVTSTVPVLTKTTTSMGPLSSYDSSSFPATTSGSPTQFSPTSNGKSHLQDILGVTDTIKLQNLAQPVNSVHLQNPITTSFSPSMLKSQLTHNISNNQKNMAPPNAQQKTNMFQSNTMFSNNRHMKNNSLPFPSHSQQHMGPGHAQVGMKSHQARSSFTYNTGSNDGTGVTGNSRTNSSFNARGESRAYSPTINGPNVWPQRGPSPSQLRSPTSQFHSSGPMYNTSKINPMAGLQSAVNSIPISVGSGPTTPTANMGPPLPSPVLQGGTPPPNQMRPPSTSSNGDKRCVSADGTVSNNTSRPKERNKRERTKSADSKNDEDKKENSAPKAKRKKSRSKEDTSKKSDSKTPNRTNQRNQQSTLSSLLDPQQNTDSSQLFIFSSRVANDAAESAQQGTSFITYHKSFIGHQRLSLSPTQDIKQDNTDTGTPKLTPTQSLANLPPLSSSPITTPSSIPETLQSPGGKQENNNDRLLNGRNDKIHGYAHSPTNKELFSPPQKTVPRQNSQKNEQPLSAEQRRHREESLNKIKKIEKMFKSNSSMPAQTSGPGQWEPGGSNMRNISQGPVPKNGDPGQLNNPQQEWRNLLQEHNVEKMRNQHMQPPGPPPPYQHGIQPRWAGPAEGFEMPSRMPHVSEMSNPRFPRMNQPRMPPDPRMPGYSTQQRMGFRFMEPTSRLPMYDSYPNIPGNNPPIPHGPNMIGPTPRPSHLGPQRGHTSEIYPFSEQLARTASLYNREPGGFDPAMLDQENTQRLSHLPGADTSPLHSQVGPGMVPTNTMDPMTMNADSRLTPVTNSLEHTNASMRMPGPAPFEIGQRMPYHNSDPMMINQMVGSPGTGMMRMPSAIGPAGSMNEAMARRGEQRPPDIPIPRSSPNYVVRPSMSSPNMTSMGQRFSHPNDIPHGQGPMMHPHPSPIPQNMARSPNTANMLKSPMGSVHSQYGSMSGPQSVPGDNVMAPLSAGPLSGQPPDWNMPGPQSSVGQHTPNNMTSQQNMPRSSGQSALSVMMQKMNSYKMNSSPLYQEAIKDTPTPPLHGHSHEAQMSHEPPPLSHNPGSNIPTQGMPSRMSRYHSYPGPQEHNMGNLSPQIPHPRNSMSSGMVPNIRNRSLTPGAINSMSGSSNINTSNYQQYQNEPNFDLKMILPSKEPSQTLSYFPPRSAVDAAPSDQIQPNDSHLPNHPLQSPQMSGMNRFSSMNLTGGVGNRPLTPGHPYNPMNAVRSPNCYPMEGSNFQGGVMHPEQGMLENNYNPNWNEANMGSGIRPQIMQGDAMYPVNRPMI